MEQKDRTTQTFRGIQLESKAKNYLLNDLKKLKKSYQIILKLMDSHADVLGEVDEGQFQIFTWKRFFLLQIWIS